MKESVLLKNPDAACSGSSTSSRTTEGRAGGRRGFIAGSDLGVVGAGWGFGVADNGGSHAGGSGAGEGRAGAGGSGFFSSLFVSASVPIF